ncbi:hypothetical protein MARLIPOL_14405 [Marinobacter lipolyticus SM19]|uniref:SnoaL-like domain-containing protein n=1 Tax=Marinobacter lipolyticus SM19 TaxID=1318628 RepID=R8AY85_9GAMM|nr:nuclear transport factor 2 family protein [Marinobacter lipolyticus]EON91222.1 hypothetical protein MARLIPOL_14405 [Marinobacter lipolyticus SM19]
MTNIEKFERYLNSYSSKDVDSVSAMFSDDITIRDWKISVKGKVTAISETKKNFSNADTIKIEILNTYESQNTVAGELRITVDGSEVLYVVDVIRFDNQGLISSIKAYIGRPD